MPKEASTDHEPARAAVVATRIAALRLGAGFLQGLALSWLYRAASAHVWPADTPYLFQPLLLTLFIVPLLFITGLGYLRTRQLLLWLSAATAVLVLLALYGHWRAGASSAPAIPAWSGGQFLLTLLTTACAGMFVAQALVLAGACRGKQRRLLADYCSYFDASWKLAIQVAASAVFALAFWLLLVLGGQLLKLVNIEFLQRLTGLSWFNIPAFTAAFGCALHVTDVRPGIVRGIRSLALSLLAWLLPMVALIVVGFLLCLPWTGLTPLWATGHASLVLIGVASALLLLINAAYQDGDMDTRLPLLMRVCVRAAALCLPPLVAIAAHALFLRVRQYGWTTDRIALACCVLMLALHAAGYAYGAMRARGMREIAQVNVFCAFVFLGLLLALLSPLADPARLAVASQVARLEAGKVEPERFDFAYLRTHGARFGVAALEALSHREGSAKAARIRQRAESALQGPCCGAQAGSAKSGKFDVAANLHLLPEGASLPASFLAQNWAALPSAALLPQCLTRTDASCDAFLIDVNGDGKPEVLLLGTRHNTGSGVLAEAADGRWRLAFTLPSQAAGCKALRDALAAGDFSLQSSAWRNLEALGSRIPLKAFDADEEFRCPDPVK
ncbi:DUF4153 domain-containing protein [Noviherbaspirillum pedocola]|uniref:DUF4153 domain-containing protein n=1 Tax=Noviherbaspirillum pedocola TaxID=2801341 RepID=A0A934W534_9BURK|nr:DUF4153 domain-containing protein [Noviherbaspirillum pedocola]MBK4734517.1 DUF4153 domain-containing protein [Noviherbaspirillum pedocola]